MVFVRLLPAGGRRGKYLAKNTHMYSVECCIDGIKVINKLQKAAYSHKRLLCFYVRCPALFFFQPCIDLVTGHYLLHESIGAGLRRFYHLYGFGKLLCRSLQGCNYFLCHFVLLFISCQPLFYLFVNSVATEYRIVFLELHAVRRILFVLGGYIAGSAGHAGCLVFCALQYDLYAVTFRFLSHFACFFTVGIPSISFTLTGIVTL